MPFHALIHPRNECLGLGKSTLIVFIDFTQIDSGYGSDYFSDCALVKEIERANLALLSLRIESYICVKTQFCLSEAVQKTRPLHAGPVLISGSL